MPKPDKTDLDFVIIYRHPSEGMIRLDMRPTGDNLRVAATYQTKEEVEAEKTQAAAQGERIKAKLAAGANAPMPEFFVSAPQGMTKQVAMKGGLTIVLKPGAAMRAAQGISAELQSQGWKDERSLPLVPQTGMIHLTREKLQLTIVFMDPGPVPAEVTITAPKVSIKVKP